MNEMYKNPETQEKPKTITLESPNKSEISYCPELGGTIASIKIKGVEILRRDPNDLEGEKKRGGIPIMFPQGGPVDKILDGATKKLEQHGFVGKSDLWNNKTNKDENKLIEEFEVGEFKEGESEWEEYASYPYDQYLLRIMSEIEEDGSVLLTQEVQNNSNKEMPISMGLHPYFRVPKDKKNEVEFDFGDEKLNEEIKNNYEKWSNGEAMIIDNPKLKNPDAILKIKIPEVGTITMDIFEKYESIWIWSKSREKGDEDDFICVEPVMQKPGGITAEDPKKIPRVEPGETFTGIVRFGLEKPGKEPVNE